MEYTITTNEDLIEFINLDRVTVEQAFEVVCKFFNAIPLMFSDYTKEKLIIDINRHIEVFGNIPRDWEQPLFLQQKGFDFDINDIYKSED